MILLGYFLCFIVVAFFLWACSFYCHLNNIEHMDDTSNDKDLEPEYLKKYKEVSKGQAYEILRDAFETEDDLEVFFAAAPNVYLSGGANIEFLRESVLNKYTSDGKLIVPNYSPRVNTSKRELSPSEKRLLCKYLSKSIDYGCAVSGISYYPRELEYGYQSLTEDVVERNPEAGRIG